jgi:hypothetical protein
VVATRALTATLHNYGIVWTNFNAVTAHDTALDVRNDDLILEYFKNTSRTRLNTRLASIALLIVD